MPASTAFLIEVDGAALPDDLAALLVSALVDDSLRLPDLFVLRFRDPDRIVLDKAKLKIGSRVKVSVMTADSQAADALISAEITALEVEYDSAGTFTVVRGYDDAHRLFRGRRSETYTQVTVSDIVTKVARRAGLSIGAVESTNTVFDHLSQGGKTDWDFLDGLARASGYEITVADGKLNFTKARKAGDAPAAGGSGHRDPLILRLGSDLLRFRAVVTSTEQVKEVQVRGWDVARKKALIATAAAATRTAQLPSVSPAGLAHTFGDPVYVATDVPYRTQAEVDGAAAALADQIAGAFAEFEGVARGNPKLRANVAISLDNVGAPFDGKYTITTSRHRYDPAAGYTTSFAVTGRQERSLYGLVSGGGRGRASQGVVIGQVSDAQDPQHQGRVRLSYPWLSDSYVSDWARTVQVGAGKDRGAMVVPEVGDEVLVIFEQGDIDRPYVLGGLFNGVDTPKASGVALIDPGSGAVNRRSLISRRGHRVDLLDEDGKTEGVCVSSSDDKLKLVLDATATTVTVHSDGSVTVEGKGGVVVDSGSSKLELKGGEISIKASTGVTVDSGGGSIKVTAGGELNLKGTMATLEGSAQAQVKGGAMCSVSAALVRIN